jgi:YihY family inner membrane protein
MTGKEQASDTSAIDQTPSEVTQTANTEVSPPPTFFSKFQHDWSLILARALAYSLQITMLSIALVLLSILGIILRRLSPQVQRKLIAYLQGIFPQAISLGNILRTIFHQLSLLSLTLEIIVIILAVLMGSRLFIVIERIFNLIYRSRSRSLIAQNLIAVGMFVLLTVLTPIMLLASSLSAPALSLVKNTTLGHVPGISVLVSLAGVLISLIAAIILFQVMYMVIPKQHIAFSKSWRGTLVAAGALQIFLAFFPLYITRFLGSYLGQIGFAVILLAFFYYFGFILLLGAEINAFYAEDIQNATDDLTTSAYSAAN